MKDLSMNNLQCSDQLFSSEQDKEKEVFEQVHHIIMEQKMFLDPSFSREKYIRLSLLNKNKVARLLKKYTGMNMNGYINSLRLEYAIKLMKENPEAPMKAIAVNSGFNNIRSFYRVFQAHYGITPVVYKEQT